MNRLPASFIATVFALACMGASAAEPAKVACAKPAEAKTSPEPRGQAPTDGAAAVSSVGNLAGGTGGGAAAASYAKAADPNSGMPNRISMNVTVPKQTQGATFSSSPCTWFNWKLKLPSLVISRPLARQRAMKSDFMP